MLNVVELSYFTKCDLFRAQMVNTTLALRTTTFLDKEVEYMPWQTSTRNLNYFFLMFDRSEVYGPMQVQRLFWLIMKNLSEIIQYSN